jgi:hypothetical protein
MRMFSEFGPRLFTTDPGVLNGSHPDPCMQVSCLDSIRGSKKVHLIGIQTCRQGLSNFKSCQKKNLKPQAMLKEGKYLGFHE